MYHSAISNTSYSHTPLNPRPVRDLHPRRAKVILFHRRESCHDRREQGQTASNAIDDAPVDGRVVQPPEDKCERYNCAYEHRCRGVTVDEAARIEFGAIERFGRPQRCRGPRISLARARVTRRLSLPWSVRYVNEIEDSMTSKISVPSISPAMLLLVLQEARCPSECVSLAPILVVVWVTTYPPGRKRRECRRRALVVLGPRASRSSNVLLRSSLPLDVCRLVG
jgi:hypothetical protein